MDGAVAKIEATWDPSDPLFCPRERAALEMASIFTENHQDFTDDDLVRWREQFSDEEIIELATFMALADGFGTVVEMLGLGAGEQAGQCEL
jgi:alkylhydroperoxidase family enzyme